MSLELAHNQGNRFDGRKLVALAAGMFLLQAQATGRSIRADRVQGRVVTIPGAAGRLAVNRDHTRHAPGEATDPVMEAGLEHLGIQQAKHATEGVVRRCSVIQDEIASKPAERKPLFATVYDLRVCDSPIRAHAMSISCFCIWYNAFFI